MPPYGVRSREFSVGLSAGGWGRKRRVGRGLLALCHCLGPLQRILIAFTPVSECGNLLCCVGIAALHAVCNVYIGRHSNAALGFMCSLLLGLCLAVTHATLRPPHQENVGSSAKDEVERKLAIEAMCKKNEEVALDLSGKVLIRRNFYKNTLIPRAHEMTS